MRYSSKPRDPIYFKGNGFFAINIGKNIGKNLYGKYSQKPLNHAKQSTTNELLQKQQLKKTVEAKDNLIGAKIAAKITRNVPSQTKDL